LEHGQKAVACLPVSCYNINKTDVKYPLARGDIIYHVQERTAEIREGDSYINLPLSSVPGIDGISTRLYFHCPYCGRRARYLYDYYKHYACRECAKLNYASQQKSGMDEMWLKMERIVEKKLGYTWWWRDYPDTPIQDLWHIPKPPYMRYEKYERLLGEFRQLQKEYERAFWTGLAKISYSCDIAQAAIKHLICNGANLGMPQV